MGCDIHLYVEYKKTVNGVTNWYSGDYLMVNPYYGTDEYEFKYNIVPLYDDRNYDLFAILADVRNSCKNKYISSPKGLPKNITKETAREAFHWRYDGHSHSYLTLKELLDFKPEPIKRKGYLTKEDAAKLDMGITPTNWCIWTNQTDCIYREWVDNTNELEPLINLLKQRAHELCLIYNWQWEREPKEAIKQAKNIRIVFWFDN